MSYGIKRRRSRQQEQQEEEGQQELQRRQMAEKQCHPEGQQGHEQARTARHGEGRASASLMKEQQNSSRSSYRRRSRACSRSNRIKRRRCK
jgi:hypothetical protein